MKVSIIGVGRVGASLGLLLVGRHLVDELVLVGRSANSASGDALDLLHATAFGKMAQVRSGGLEDTAQSDVIVLCVASKDRSGHSWGGRRALGLESNWQLLEPMLSTLARLNPEAVVLIATNPVDALTTLVSKCGGWPAERVIGMGTLLDTMRLRVMLSERCGIAPSDVRAYMLGEHGDSQFAAFSSATAGGGRLTLKAAELGEIEAAVRQAGHDIAQLKGFTNHGIALAMAEVIEVILKNSRQIMPLSTRITGFCGVDDVCLSIPVVVGRRGVRQSIDVELSAEERTAFRRCAAVVRAAVDQVVLAPRDVADVVPDSTYQPKVADYSI